MNKKILFVLTLFCAVNISKAQSYNDLWKDVELNVKNRLPETALSYLEKIEHEALKDNNQKELLKTYLYRFKIFSLQPDMEDAINNAIHFADDNIAKLQEPEKSIFNLAIASLYINYINNYAGNNVPIHADVTTTDLKFLDEESIMEIIENHINNALNDTASLQKNTTASYYEILSVYDDNKKPIEYVYEPTLYDYINHYIIDYYISINQDDKAMDLYNNLIAFDKKSSYQEAATYNQILQIELAYNNQKEKDIDSYINKLEELKDENLDNEIVTSIMAMQAKIILQNRDSDNDSLYNAMSQRVIDICNEAEVMFPNSDGTKNCIELRNIVLEKKLAIQMQNVMLPNKPIPLSLTYKNLTNPNYRIYKIETDSIDFFRKNNKRDIVRELLNRDYIIQKQILISSKNDYKEHSSLIALPELNCGTYILMFSTNNLFSIEEQPAIHVFQLSNMSYVTTNNNDTVSVFVLNRDSGEAIENVNVEIYENEYDYKNKDYVKKNLITKKTDKNGCVIIPNHNSYNTNINLYKDNDRLLSESYFRNFHNRENESIKTTFFTDRAIYRPGQVVYFKGVMINQKPDDMNLLVGNETVVTFLDSNYQEIASQTFTTDEYGSFNGSFNIPNNVANGIFCIKNENGNITFKVEEYKRPTFEIIFNDIDTAFKFNDSVNLSGKIRAYAGFALDNINFEYQVVRRTFAPYRYFYNAYDNEEQIAFGKGKCNQQGDFNLGFKLLPDEEINDNFFISEFIVNVTATNPQGETQTANYSLIVSETDLIINIDSLKSCYTNKTLHDAKFFTQNLKGSKVDAKIIRKIYKVNDNSRFICDDYHFDTQLLSDEELNTLFPHFDYYPERDENLKKNLVYEDVVYVDGESHLFPDRDINFKTGKYIVELISVDNEIVNISHQFVVIDENSKKMPYTDLCFSYADSDVANVDETVNFYLGSSAKDVNAYIVIKHGNDVRFLKKMKLNNNVKKISYKIKEEDRGTIVFQAFFVKYNEYEIVSHQVDVPFDNMLLDISLDVERDYLLPGAVEKWNLTVKDFKNNGVLANVLAGMYDASLDVFAKQSWNLKNTPSLPYSTLPSPDNGFTLLETRFIDNNYYYFPYNIFNFNLLSNYKLVPFFAANRVYGMARMNSLMSKDDVKEKEISETSVNNIPDNQEKTAEIMLRDNFNETAFFYPNLKSNSDGSLSFSFTMPDAVTRWNLMMLAYTKDLKVGTLKKTFTASKPLMIISDMPRFCYENDTMYIVANVVNGSEKICEPTAKLEIFDAITMQPLDLILSEQEVIMNQIEPASTQAVKWKVTFPEDINLVAFRFSVTEDNFSDAEQHLLPILSDEVFMTETYPMTINADSEKDFHLDFDDENEINQGLTLNFCSNPTWYAIQALPYLAQGNGKSANAAFNVFYANSLAKYIAYNIPNFQNIIKKWSMDSSDNLMSQLENNENLKAVLLEETPWVLDAKNETEQKSMIVNLFDVNTFNYKNNESLNLIKQKQTINGAWAWLDGMPESSFITQYFLSGFGKLFKMNVINSLEENQQQDVNIICEKSIDYLTNEIVKIYKESENKTVSYNCIDELYALSFFDFEEENEFKVAKDFFMKRLQNDWRNYDFGTQAQIAIILYRENIISDAELIMKSLKERAVKSNDIGMYWGNDISKHTLIMEAFREISPDNHLLEQMTIWLLCNKRTNMWEDAPATVNAIYSILQTNNLTPTKLIINDISNNINIKVENADHEQYSTFVQKYWDKENISNLKNILVKNQTDNIVWGGLFRQYFVSTDNLKKHNNAMSIERKLFVEKKNEQGSYLIPIDECEVKVGDKIVVHLDIESSQDMEYVFLKDLRAACFEPEEQMSQYKYHDEMFYYQSNSDTYMGFYFDRLPKGKHRVSYSMFVSKQGNFSNGYAFIQCMYAPEFSAYSEGVRCEIR